MAGAKYVYHAFVLQTPEMADAQFNRRMRKTACPVVWKGHGVQFPVPPSDQGTGSVVAAPAGRGHRIIENFLEQAGRRFFAIGLVLSIEIDAGLKLLAEDGLLRKIGNQRQSLLGGMDGCFKIASIRLGHCQGVE